MIAELRRAQARDIAFIMACERRPGYESLVGRWEQDRHRLRISDAEFTYLIGEAGLREVGFAILHHTWMRPENLYLKRIAVHDAGRGDGKALLRALTDWVFANTDTHRFWLEVVEHNARARRLYLGLGWKEEGVVREAYFDDRLQRRGSFIQMSILKSEWQR